MAGWETRWEGGRGRYPRPYTTGRVPVPHQQPVWPALPLPGYTPTGTTAASNTPAPAVRGGCPAREPWAQTVKRAWAARPQNGIVAPMSAARRSAKMVGRPYPENWWKIG